MIVGDGEGSKEGRERGFIVPDRNHKGRSVNVKEILSSNCKLRWRVGGWGLRLGFGGTKGDWRERKLWVCTRTRVERYYVIII